MMQPVEYLQVTRIVFKQDRMICWVTCTDKAWRYANQRLAQILLRQVPSLADHDCVNSENLPFKEILATTSLPHILEHLTIDCQVRDAAKKKAYDNGLFVGTTEWLNEANGTARIELSYQDDLEALAALKRALLIVNRAIARYGKEE